MRLSCSATCCCTSLHYSVVNFYPPPDLPIPLSQAVREKKWKQDTTAEHTGTPTALKKYVSARLYGCLQALRLLIIAPHISIDDEKL